MSTLPAPVLQVGDYIKVADNGLVQGEIVAIGSLPVLGRGYKVRRPDGQEDFIPEVEAVLLGGLSLNQIAALEWGNDNETTA